jgi:hypothetical protein
VPWKVPRLKGHPFPTGASRPLPINVAGTRDACFLIVQTARRFSGARLRGTDGLSDS